MPKECFLQEPVPVHERFVRTSKNGELQVSKEILEEKLNMLKKTFSDESCSRSMPDIQGLVRPTIPGIDFDVAEPTFTEVKRFIMIMKARSAAV